MLKIMRSSFNIKVILFVTAILIVGGVLFYTNRIVEKLRDDSRRFLTYNAQLVANALSSDDQNLDFVFNEIINHISFPVIISVEPQTGIYAYKNVDLPQDATDEEKERLLTELIVSMDSENEAVPIDYMDTPVMFIHYGDSELIRQLRWLPYIEITIVALFILLGFIGFQFIRSAERRGIWVGMAKETAHQLGTPLSSLMGWLELLKDRFSQNSDDQEVLADMESDLQRLNQVAQRFSKIGSGVTLIPLESRELIQPVVQYIRRRIPYWDKRINITIENPENPIIMANMELFAWALENLLKNAIDANDKSLGEIVITVEQKLPAVFIEVRDNGRGIAARDRKNIFRPGWSSKKRGWGLGLSLTKRIIEEYHHGRISVQSSPGKGTTFRLVLRGQANQ
ncbi:MAG: HAMP domain-containing histidine kinase [Candidatus Marinimicrobia bacterium]|nr:HAMP domain-containing histidine kinase [Candidatus Neomarinimicrobiota bacterium]